MEEDIQNHSPTVMFRWTPCIYKQIIYYESKELNYVEKPYKRTCIS